MEKSSSPFIRLDISQAHGGYDLLKQIMKSNKWHESKKNSDIVWLAGSINELYLKILCKSNSLVNKYPKLYKLAKKKENSVTFRLMEKYFPGEFDFYPKTYLYPEDKESLEEDVKRAEVNCKGTYILKPSGGSQGTGIQLFQTKSELQNILLTENSKEFIIQKYITNPLLIKKKKFDFRVYVLLTGTNPMNAYIANEGLARFCTVSVTVKYRKIIRNLKQRI